MKIAIAVTETVPQYTYWNIVLEYTHMMIDDNSGWVALVQSSGMSLSMETNNQVTHNIVK